MDSTRWQRIQSLFHDALALSSPERETFLQSACAGDRELFSEVLSMLHHDSAADSLLDRQLADVAHQTLANSDALPVRQFGPYRVVGVLGEGGMGVVYLAERTDLGNQVAIKVLRDAWLSPARRERFASEQRTLAQLNHPSIAQLYDADTLPDGTPWFAMERVEGVPLTQYCRQHASSVEERLRLFRMVCEAVQFAHGHAVIHRDLKPSNILVKKDGTVRLLDFGIAKQLESFDLTVDQTTTGLRLLTPAYAAPEQIRGDRVGIHTDVYALGVILYELLTGHLPFDLSNLTPGEAATVITEHEPGKPSSRVAKDGSIPAPRRSAWADLDVLCLTALHKDPQRRYSSVEALVRDVDHYLDGQPLDARPDTLRYRAGKFIRRHRQAVSAAALVFALIVGLVTFFTWRLAKARNAALAEAARTQRVQQFMMNLFRGGDQEAGPAADMKVLTMVDRGVQQARALSTDPKVQAELYATLGLIYQKLGKLDRAEELLTQALEERNSLFGADSTEAAESLVALGQLRADQAKYEDAEKLVRQGLEIDQRHLPPNHTAVINARTALGVVLTDRGNYDQATRILAETVRLQANPNPPTSALATSLSALADAHYYAGHYSIADPLYRRVLDIHRQLYGPQHPLVADDLASLGSVQQDLGFYPQAEQYYRQALAITEAYYGKDSPNTAADLNMLGRSILYQKRNDEARGLVEQALAIREQAFGPNHPSVATTLNELGNIAYQTDHYDEAEKYWRRMEEIYRNIYGDHHYLIAVALSNLGSLYSAEKDYPRAEQTFREVLRRFGETLPPDHVNTGIAHVKLGRVLLRENRFADAQTESLAGYEILKKQSNPSDSFVRAAEKDLAADYDALKQPDQAAQFRALLAAK